MKRAFFLIGLGLLGLNFTGLFVSLRHPDIYKEKTLFENDITLSEEELFTIIKRKYPSREKYVIVLNAAVNKGIAHYWGDDVDKYNLRIPIHENYLLYLITHLYSLLTNVITPVQKLFSDFREPTSIFEKYEFSDYRKAIERGVGLCSQQAIIVAELLRKREIPSKIVFLRGHVVVMAHVDDSASENKWWIVDADYGVIIKHDIETIEKSPECIAPYYREAGYSEATIQKLLAVYSLEDNKVYGGVAEYHGKDRFYKYYFEYLLYFLKWLIPVGLCAPLCLEFVRRRHRRSYSQG
ncbi:MAG: hypothetical protein GY801_46325 [bacterium]|nr:hypothetical protein [bacterium]